MDRESSLSLSYIRKHDVFISFRHEDTGNNFSGNLISALKERGMFPFMSDDKEEAVSPELLKAIELSPISIVVFSRNYAASTRCLEELAYIVECHGLDEQNILPVFYDVDPSEVEEQRGVYQQAFAEHEERFKENLKKVKRWRKSMTKVTYLSGWNLQNEKETEVIHDIVRRAIVLSHKSVSVEDDPVGMLFKIYELECLMLVDRLRDDYCKDSIIIGIVGMSGIGKTTLAKLVYNRVSWRFDDSCFLTNVTRASQLTDVVVALQKQLHHPDQTPLNEQITDFVWESSRLRRIRRYLNTLIVIDDVRRLEQLEAITRYFGRGTRVLITSRDTEILRSYVDIIYEIKGLDMDEALQLFGRHAFKSGYPEKYYKDLTNSALKCLEGNPLAIKLLGSFLFNQSVSQWKSALARLEKIPDLTEKINYVVQESFNSLEYSAKEMFLDIACFFIGEKIDYVKETLHSCGYNPEIGIKVLIDRSFITISEQRIQMHDLVQEIGLQIIIQQSLIEPGVISRLWFKEELYHVMRTNRPGGARSSKISDFYQLRKLQRLLFQDGFGYINQTTPQWLKSPEMELVEAIALNQDVLQKVSFWAESLSKMSKLRLFIFRQYPLTCLPSTFEPRTLVELVMSNSSITKLWEGIKILPNLRSMDLRNSKDLIKTPDLRGIPKLERLDLEGCTGLLQVDSSNGLLPKLKFLNMRNCKITEDVERILYYRHVEVIGILGMNGIGKTALAKLVYNRVSWQFDASCFLADVTKVSKLSGVVALQEQLLRQTLKQKNVKIRDVDEGTLLIRTHL